MCPGHPCRQEDFTVGMKLMEEGQGVLLRESRECQLLGFATDFFLRWIRYLFQRQDDHVSFQSIEPGSGL